jgi:hypothetical protein
VLLCDEFDASGMSDHDHDDGHGHGHEDWANPGPDRETSPMQAFSTRDVGVGFAVMLVGLVVVFGLPLVLA